MGLKEQQGPLRKILGVKSLPIGFAYGSDCDAQCLHEIYECGHAAIPKSDLFGETNAYKRRCRYCRDDKPAHVNLQTMELMRVHNA